MLLSCHTAQKMKFSIKDFFSKCDQIRWLRRIWSHLLNKSLMENFIFWAVSRTRFKMNLHSIVSWMSRSFFLKTGTISDVLSDRNGIWTKWDFVYELSGRRFESRCSHKFSRKLFLMLLTGQISLLIAFISLDIGQYVHCNCLLPRLWRHEFQTLSF